MSSTQMSLDFKQLGFLNAKEHVENVLTILNYYPDNQKTLLSTLRESYIAMHKALAKEGVTPAALPTETYPLMAYKNTFLGFFRPRLVVLGYVQFTFVHTVQNIPREHPVTEGPFWANALALRANIPAPSDVGDWFSAPAGKEDWMDHQLKELGPVVEIAPYIVAVELVDKP